jgi:hypothetical protein
MVQNHCSTNRHSLEDKDPVIKNPVSYIKFEALSKLWSSGMCEIWGLLSKDVDMFSFGGGGGGRSGPVTKMPVAT